MMNEQIASEIEQVIRNLYAIRLPAQELTASTAIMRETIRLNDICKKLKEETTNDADNQQG